MVATASTKHSYMALAFLIRLWGLGERLDLCQRGQGQSPAENSFNVI